MTLAGNLTWGGVLAYVCPLSGKSSDMDPQTPDHHCRGMLLVLVIALLLGGSPPGVTPELCGCAWYQHWHPIWVLVPVPDAPLPI